MPAPVTQAISIRGKSLRNRFKVIFSLVFFIPAFVAFYIFFRKGMTDRFGYVDLFIGALTLGLVLTGFVMLRQVFNAFKRETSERIRIEEELNKQEQYLTHISHHDLLTGLPNRKLLMEHLKRLLAEAVRHRRPMAFMLLDLDNFKAINDTLGYVVGDHVLQEAARRVTRCLRASDIVARPGGDEFSIVLQELEGKENSAMVARKILSALGKPMSYEGKRFYVSTSIGISFYPGDGDDEHTLLKHAEAAMYYAKETGKNTYQHYSATISPRSYEDLSLASDLHRALDARELFLEYQPQYDLSTGAIVSAEALVRWDHPILGVLPPMKFIPMAERTGLIIPMGEWIMQSVCEQIKAWTIKGSAPMRVSVNTSARQFQQKEYAQTLERAIREAAIDPSQFDLEITESIIMQDIQGTASTLRQLNALGVHISVDDFGTGYSSLSYLKQFPIQTLKIDRSFIRDLTTDPDDASIVSAVIAMAHSMRMKVVAEGVETSDQLELLRSLDCDRIQGFLLGRPVPVEQFSALLQQSGAQ